ncbi:probable ATP-dependent RNA helicase DDX4 isoform X5 [Ctenopharyngodon idella]|uniref:probable ATP-dependent RNA helicase DDX4 isoform X4 n=1 Tax=Ctenopharyngodon idella TaxID=7959 RepID=UPI00222F7AD7|nr:probable ATP-dependent RNA helicase DDX4 isoform X4 [Ctenopharyngodon idella]XP_051766729.1 probable ATP-dependent RNA helicase DDX4 isoform X5 [Ctenopharyngodon idella]
MDDWEEDQSPVVSWNSGFGLGSSGTDGGFKSFYKGSAGNEKSNNEDSEGSSWRTSSGDGFRGRGGRGGSRGGRGGLRNTFKSETDENGNDEGWKGGEGRGRGRGGFRGGFRDGGDEETGKRGFGRGGFRGQNEEVFSKVSTAGKVDQEAGENAGPKVVYVPPPPPEDENSIFSQFATGINFDKYDDIPVEVSGSNAPKAIMTFDEAKLCESLSKNVTKSGYVKPTPVQKYGIPIISAGRDLMACAQTGSGKTAAFLLPILQRFMTDGVAASKFSEVQEPEAIIVAPTRELINQIYLEARKFAYGTCVRPVVVYGGINTGYTIREVLKGCNVLCGTPGRLLDIIGRGKVGLSKLRYLILDEADRMLDMGFEPDMRKLVGSPGMPAKEDRQTLMFSATFPEEIQRLAAEFLKVDYLFLAVGVVGGACSDVEQTIIQVDQYSKREQLLELLKTTGTERTMVFVETKRSADFIATFLCQEKISTTSIHGDREQREREKALSDFRTGQCPVLVATSVAARGLDIEHVQHVVNFDLPNNIDEYVHRIGRTGRCGNIGRAVSFFNPESDTPLARSLVKVLSGAQQTVPKWLEEIAFSAHGTTGINPRGRLFASTDTRKGGSFRTDEPPPASAPKPAAAADDEEWE